MPAPLKNNYGLGNHRAGRRAKYATPEELLQRILNYFDSLGDQRPTITGLGLFLGFSSRQSLYDYAKKEGFAYPIKRALLVIEISYEEMLLGSNYRAAIFALKNMGWTDKVNRTTKTVISKSSSPFSTDKSINQQ